MSVSFVSDYKLCGTSRSRFYRACMGGFAQCKHYRSFKSKKMIGLDLPTDPLPGGCWIEQWAANESPQSPNDQRLGEISKRIISSKEDERQKRKAYKQTPESIEKRNEYRRNNPDVAVNNSRSYRERVRILQYITSRLDPKILELATNCQEFKNYLRDTIGSIKLTLDKPKGK